jgi:hypothetical protein
MKGEGIAVADTVPDHIGIAKKCNIRKISLGLAGSGFHASIYRAFRGGIASAPMHPSGKLN